MRLVSPSAFALLLLLAAPPARSDVSYIIDTAAGSDLVGDDGAATSAQLSNAHGIAMDRQGNLYITDTDNHRVRKVSAAGVISTLAGNGHAGYSGDGGPAVQAQLNSPYGLAVDAGGNVYVADFNNECVRKITPDGIIMTIAGTGRKGSDGDGGPATAAQLISPRNLVFDSLGNLYVSEFEGHRVRRIGRDGIISTAAGTGVAGLNLDPKSASIPAIAAQLAYPAGLAVDANNTLYIADSRNNMIRRVSNGNIMTAIDGRTDPAFLLYSPTGLAIDKSGFVYITDSTAFVRQLASPPSPRYPACPFPATVKIEPRPSTLRMRSVLPSGFILTAAGSGVAALGADNTFAPLAPLNQPRGVALDPAGNLYIADTGNHRIVRITATGTLATVAGNGSPGWAGDNGRAAVAQLNAPAAIAFDARGNLYIADTFNQLIRKVTAAGIISTVAGIGAAGFTGDGGPATAATLNFPAGVGVDTSGVVYIADTWNHRIRTIDGNGAIHTIAGSDAAGYKGDGGQALAAQLDFPSGIAVDVAGTVYFSDRFNNRVRKLSPEAAVLPPAGVTDVAVVNSASLQPGPVAPGEMVTILAAGIGPEVGVRSHTDANGMLETSLAGVQVQFDGTPAPLFSVQSGQINLQVPYGVSGTTQMEVFYQATSRIRLVVPIADSAPAIFATRIVNADGTYNSASNPVATGTIVTLYVTGEGVVAPGGVTGRVPQPPYAQPVLPVDLKIGGNSCELLYAASAPGMVGMMEIDARVPSGFVSTGILPVVLTVGMGTSQAGVTIAVK